MAFTDLLTDLVQPWMKIRVYNIKIDNQFQLLSGTQTAGFVLTNFDGTGVGTWRASSAGGGVTSIDCDDSFSAPKSLVFNRTTGIVNVHASGNFGPTGAITTRTLVASSSISTVNISQSGSGTLHDITLAGDWAVDPAGSLSAATETLWIGQTTPAAPVAGQVLTALDADGSMQWKTLPTPTAVTNLSCTDAFSPRSILFSGATGVVTARCSGNFGPTGEVLSEIVTASDVTATDTFTYANAPVVDQFLKCVSSGGLAEWADIPGGVVSVLPGPFASVAVSPGTGIGLVTVETTGLFGNVSNPVDIKTYGGVQLLGSSKLKMVTGAGSGKVMVSDGSGVGSWQDEKSVGVSSMAQDGVNNNLIFTGSGGGPPYTGAVTAYCNPDFKSLPLTAGGSTLGSVTTTEVDCTAVDCSGVISCTTLDAAGVNATGHVTCSGDVSGITVTTGVIQHPISATQPVVINQAITTNGLGTPWIAGTPGNRGTAIATGILGGQVWPAWLNAPFPHGVSLGYCGDIFIMTTGNQIFTSQQVLNPIAVTNGGANYRLPDADDIVAYLQSVSTNNASIPNAAIRVGLYWYWTIQSQQVSPSYTVQLFNSVANSSVVLYAGTGLSAPFVVGANTNNTFLVRYQDNAPNRFLWYSMGSCDMRQL